MVNNIVLTKSSTDNQAIIAAVKSLNIEISSLPLFTITPIAFDTENIAPEYDVIIFISKNAINSFFDSEILTKVKAKNYAVVGNSSFLVLKQYGIDENKIIRPINKTENSSNLYGELAKLDLDSALIVKGEYGLTDLQVRLKQNGTSVQELELYARKPVKDINMLAKLATDKLPQYLFITCNTSIESLEYAKEQRLKLDNCNLIVASDRIANYGKDKGFNIVGRLAGASNKDIIDYITQEHGKKMNQSQTNQSKLWSVLTVFNIVLLAGVAIFVYLNQEELRSLTFNNNKELKQQQVKLQALLSELEQETKRGEVQDETIEQLTNDFANKVEKVTADLAKLSELQQKDADDINVNHEYKVRYFMSVAAIELKYFENKIQALTLLNKALALLDNDERSEYRLFGYKLKNFYRELEGINIPDKSSFVQDVKFLKSQLIHKPELNKQLDTVIDIVEKKGATNWNELKDLIKVRRQDPRLKPLPSSLGTEFEAKRFELLLEQALLAVILKNQNDYNYTMSLIVDSGNNLALSNLVRSKEKFLHIIKSLSELKIDLAYPDLLPLIEEFDNV